MTPAARVAAAADLLDDVLAGAPAEQALLRWSRASRFAGSGDRVAVRDLVFQALRRRNSYAALGGALTGRGLMIGLLRDTGQDLDQVFTGIGHAPAALTKDESLIPANIASIDLPEWVLPFWRQSLGADADRMALEMSRRAPVWLRVNPLKGSREQAIAALARDGITVEMSPLLLTALLVTGGERRIRNSSSYINGLVELQDLSPQLACAVLPLNDGDRVLDYCAGGGGKTLALAGRALAEFVAHDGDPSRMKNLELRARRAGVPVTQTASPQGQFQLVIADVPCSGSGTWRRTPDAKWRLTPHDFDRLLAVQESILTKAAEFVAPGGHLAYMTCSVLASENHEMVDRFTSSNPKFFNKKQHSFSPLTASDGFFVSILSRC